MNDGPKLKESFAANYWLGMSEQHLAELPGYGVPEQIIIDLRKNAAAAVHSAIESEQRAPVFFAQDENGMLRRWVPSAEALCGAGMAGAIRGQNGRAGAVEIIEFLSERLVNVYGENRDTDYHIRARFAAQALKDALPREGGNG